MKRQEEGGIKKVRDVRKREEPVKNHNKGQEKSANGTEGSIQPNIDCDQFRVWVVLFAIQLTLKYYDLPDGNQSGLWLRAHISTPSSDT